MSDPQPLFDAIKAGDRKRLSAIVEEQPALAAARDSSGISALMLASYQMRQDMVEVLRRTGLDLDLFEAAALGDTGRLDALLQEEPEASREWSADGFTALHLAAFFGHVDAVRLLLDRGAAPATASHNPMRVHPLHSAAAGRNGALVELLLERGCEVNARQAGGYTALHAAATHGDDGMVQALLRHGADPSLALDDGKTAADLARDHGFEALGAILGAG